MGNTATSPQWPAMGHIPDHVPAELIKPFSFAGEPEMSRCPFSATSRLHEGPRIFWNPANPQFGGSWVPTRAEDIRYVLNTPSLFSNKGEAGFSGLVGEQWDLIPLELDPPEHGKFRQLLNPLLAPPAVAKLTPGVTERAVRLIEAVRAKGGCEFMDAFGRAFPIGVFMQLMGLPEEHYDTFVTWEFELLHSGDMARRVAAAVAIRDFLRTLASERRANPTGDLTSFVVQAQIDGKDLSDDEVMGILYLLFAGGLDTVAASLGFFFRHLAENPEQQTFLRENPDRIDKSIEEMLRRFSVVTVHRMCKVDLEMAGVQMRAGDWITINDSLGSLDPAEFDEPMEVDLDRKNVRHLAFSFGPHFCMGSHLARRELSIALHEWLARVPTWRIRPGSPVQVHGGLFGVEHLELEWDAA
ncbi:cytochrome P450 [Sphingomonas immobilis]|uniref:Cytochrome P450 n=1 Tax=Sphingomonas immobilis TaxID=3063997 RepID=A0ABT9A1A1_9SPHN|nr:cytochrome P450 [Sphingomonas sp. CA1-15]MDO7843608.1 cytochrome P450 [Sphingomonas sp. CA1-15]